MISLIYFLNIAAEREKEMLTQFFSSKYSTNAMPSEQEVLAVLAH